MQPTSPKVEALEALDTAIKILEAPEPLTAVRHRLVAAALSHAWSSIVQLPDRAPRRRKAGEEEAPEGGLRLP